MARSDRTIYLGQAQFVYWLGPGGIWPYAVTGYVGRGGADPYSIDPDGTLWRYGRASCGHSFTAYGELFPNQPGAPAMLTGSTGQAFASNITVGAGRPDCRPLISLDPSRVGALLEEARKTTTNQAVFDYQKLLAIGNQPGATIALSQLIEESYIRNLASATRNKIIEKFKSYQYIQDLQRAGLLN